jgi:hypothetical protein
MDNGSAAFMPLAVATLMAVMAFIYIRYPHVFKEWALFEFQRRINQAYPVSYYRNCGWMLAVGSVLMLLVALFRWLIK